MEFIADDNETAARGFYTKVMETVSMLAQFPLAGRSRPEFSPNLRSFPVGDYLLFYKRSKQRVTIVRVLNGAIDLQAAVGRNADR